MTDLSGAIIGHLVGDFLVQNDWMAQGKKQSSWICLVHVLVYSACVCMFAGWWTPSYPGYWVWWLSGDFRDGEVCGYAFHWTLLPFILVAVPHFLIDRWGFVAWWMKWLGQSNFAKPPMSPWSRIAVDNSMHLICLWALARFLYD